ncbi:MAG TPA: indole-3-glycerol-phosphate synthase [Polyangiaceae bacterium]|nr:indole-3-glycerol-phosphate synthase [Polyangiaceae bacterium]
MAVLESILAAKRSFVRELAGRPLPAPPPLRPFSLKRPPGGELGLIAEIKRRSPSAGALSTKLSVEERAAAYEGAGARMVSVLTDTPFFDGAYEHLTRARAACKLPLLCKDFVIDERQLDAARAYGAEAVLLIVRCLDTASLSRLHRAALERELVPFVEVANEEETRVAIDVGATLVGVNARDLDTLQMDRERAARVLELLPTNITRVHLSGLGSAAAVGAIAASAVDAALIGEALMRADDPAPLLSAMIAEARRHAA